MYLEKDWSPLVLSGWTSRSPGPSIKPNEHSAWGGRGRGHCRPAVSSLYWEQWQSTSEGTELRKHFWAAVPPQSIPHLCKHATPSFKWTQISPQSAGPCVSLGHMVLQTQQLDWVTQWFLFSSLLAAVKSRNNRLSTCTPSPRHWNTAPLGGVMAPLLMFYDALHSVSVTLAKEWWSALWCLQL